jgi:hypothetical protein
VIIRAKAYWAKVIGKPVKAYDPKDPPEWTIDLALDEDTKKKLLAEGMTESYIKNKGDDRGDFITFRRKSIKQDGNAAKPIEVVDDKRKPWDDRKLGNGTVVNAMVVLNEIPGPGGKLKNKPGLIKLQVVELVEYAGGERDEFPSSEDEEWA